MNIGELARQAEVTPRTIRYYVEQGLLPPPERGYPAEYTGEHADRLELIRLLKDERMPLEEIKTTLDQLDAGEVRDLIVKARERLAAQPPPVNDSAADYIARVLENSAQRNVMLENQARKRQAPPLAGTFEPPRIPAPLYPPQVPTTPAPAPTMPPPPAPLVAPGMPPVPLVPFPKAPPGRTQDEERDEDKYEDRNEDKQARLQDAGTWQRIQLTPSVELHYQVTAGEQHRNLVDRLVDLAARLLGRGPEKES